MKIWTGIRLLSSHLSFYRQVPKYHVTANISKGINDDENAIYPGLNAERKEI